jgi:hypothetical protein
VNQRQAMARDNLNGDHKGHAQPAFTISELPTCVLTSGRPAPHLTVVNDVNGTMICRVNAAVAVRQGMEPASVLQSRRGGCC